MPGKQRSKELCIKDKGSREKETLRCHMNEQDLREDLGFPRSNDVVSW
jgi:hypothetical protein